jgi:hypothetical protein
LHTCQQNNQPLATPITNMFLQYMASIKANGGYTKW